MVGLKLICFAKICVYITDPIRFFVLYLKPTEKGATKPDSYMNYDILLGMTHGRWLHFYLKMSCQLPYTTKMVPLPLLPLLLLLSFQMRCFHRCLRFVDIFHSKNIEDVQTYVIFLFEKFWLWRVKLSSKLKQFRITFIHSIFSRVAFFQSNSRMHTAYWN